MLKVCASPIKTNRLVITVKLPKVKTVAGQIKHQFHKKLIKLGQQMALVICPVGDTITSRDVVEALITQGLYQRDPADPEYWTGAMIPKPRFIQSNGKGWKEMGVPDETPGTHGPRLVKLYKRVW